MRLHRPINRSPLTRDQCVRLDTHMRAHHPEQPFVSVTDAFDLFKLNGGGNSNVTTQREATAILQHLFRFQSMRHADASGHAINFTEGGLSVVDDDDILTPLNITDNTTHSTGAVMARSWESDFPMLPGSRPKTSEHCRVSPQYGPQKKEELPSSSNAFPPLPSPLPQPEQHIKPSSTKVPALKKGGKEKFNELSSLVDQRRPCGKIKQTLYPGPKMWTVPKPIVAKSAGVARRARARE